MLRALISLILLLFNPIVLVPVLTISPFLVPVLDFLNRHTSNLTRTLSTNPATVIDFNVIVYALCCSVAYISFYGFAFRQGRKERKNGNKPCNIPNYFARKTFRFAAFWTIIIGGIGVFTVIYTLGIDKSIDIIQLTIGELNISIIKLVVSGVSVDEWIYGPESFRFSDTVPGIVRMFGFWTISAYLMWLGVFLASPPWLNKRKAYFVLLCLGLMVVYYFLVTQSRFPLVGSMAMTAFVAIYRYSISQRKNSARLGKNTIVLLVMAFIFFVIASAIIITRVSRAQELNPFLDYADLGVANTILSLRSATAWTFGFSTVLSPLGYVFKALGIDLLVATDAEWIGNPAACLLAYSYQDFGYFGFFVYGFMGLVAGWIRRKHLQYPDSVLWASVYLWLLVGLTTIWTVPLFRGPDFWAALLGIVFVVYIINRYQRRLLWRLK
jgi:hypothetical protein